MRVIALIPVYNEEMFVQPLIEHLTQHGVEAYFIDNESTDRTREILERFIGRGVVGVETLSREHGYDFIEVLSRIEELALTLDADWFIKLDADEFRLPPNSRQTLAEALAEEEENGYNAVNFIDFMFLPTIESPDHAHPKFQETMRWYHPFVAKFPNRINAWKRQPQRVSLIPEAGHHVAFPGLRMSPRQYRMRHYHFLNLSNAIKRHVGRPNAQRALDRGWHGWRSALRAEAVVLPSEVGLSVYTGDDQLDPSNAWLVQYIGTLATAEAVASEHLAECGRPIVPIVFDSISSDLSQRNEESGADLLAAMLEKNSEMVIAPEIDFIAGTISELQSFHYPSESFVDSLNHHIRWSDFGIESDDFKEELAKSRPYFLSEAFRKLFCMSASKAGKSRWGARFHQQNAHGLNCGQIKAIFPEARFIFVNSDSMATAGERPDCATWQHFMELSHEEIVARPVEVLKKVCAFIDLPFEQSMLKNNRKSLRSWLFGKLFAPKA